MDKDKDGILGKEDLRATWDQVGKLVTDKELEDMLAEAPGPVNFTQLLTLFATRMAGGTYISRSENPTVIRTLEGFAPEISIDKLLEYKL